MAGRGNRPGAIGISFHINVNGDTAGIGRGTGGILVRANAVGGVDYRLDSSERTTEPWLNTLAFSIPPAFTFGNLGRNTVIGPGYFNADATLTRTFDLTERYRLQIRGEFFNLFNLFNHPNYKLVGRLINVPDTFGKMLNQYDPRQVQPAAKIFF